MRKALLAILIAAMVLMLAGCMDMGDVTDPDATPAPPLAAPEITDRAAFYEYYNQVSLNDTLTGLKERYGEPEKNDLEGGTQYTWQLGEDRQHGFAVALYETGKVRAKVVYYQDIRQIVPLCSGKNLNLANTLTKEYSYDMVCSVFGAKGVELAQITTDASQNPGIARLYAWSDGESLIQAFFGDNGMMESVTVGQAK